MKKLFLLLFFFAKISFAQTTNPVQSVNGNISTTQSGVWNTNMTAGTASFNRITDGTNNIFLTNVAPAPSVFAIPTRIVPSTTLFGSNLSTAVAYTTNANNLVLTNCLKLVLENNSTTTNATVVVGGVSVLLGAKSSGNLNPNQRIFEAVFDNNKRLYTRLPTISVNALGSNVVGYFYFGQ